MQMSNEKKIEILMKNLQIIKKNYGKNRISIGEVVVKLFAIDIDLATEVWIQLLQELEPEVKGPNSLSIIGSIIVGAGDIIGKGKMDEIVLKNPVIKKSVFSYSCQMTAYSPAYIIARQIKNNNIEMANELLEMLFENPYKEDKWYYIMQNAIPDKCEITESAYELLDMWCDKVECEDERAKLSIKMMQFID